MRPTRWAITLLMGMLSAVAVNAQYFTTTYNAIPATGSPMQLKMLGVWGAFTNGNGFSNNFKPSVGDEVGAFWNNGTNDILVGRAIINSAMVEALAYGTVDIYGRCSEHPEGLSYGLTNGATIYFRIYEVSKAAEFKANPNLTSFPQDMFYQHDLAVWQSVGSNHPFRLRAVALTNNVVLRWPNPLDCGFLHARVHVRVLAGNYPETLDDGEQIYQGEDQVFEHKELVAGESYYYTIWCSNDGTTFIEPQ